MADVSIPWMVARLDLSWPCQTCKGNLVIGTHTYCGTCGMEFGSQVFDDGMSGPTMPCGHPWKDLDEENIYCPDCDGMGEFSRSITVAELASAIQEYFK